MSIRLVMLNTWGGRVHGPLMDYLKAVDADIYCLQEICKAPKGTPESLVYVEGREHKLPVRPNLYRELAALLPDHQGYFCPEVQGSLFDADGTEYTGIRFGIATFVRDTLAVIEERSKFVFGWYRGDGWGAPPLPRSAHCLRLYDHESHVELVVAHMHGLWDKRGKIDIPERKTQVSNLAVLVEEMSPSLDRTKTIICGDFNVLPESYTLRHLRWRLKVEDLVTNRGFTSTRTSLYAKNPLYADYMLVSSGINVEHFDVPAQPEVSDHRPLVLNFS